MISAVVRVVKDKVLLTECVKVDSFSCFVFADSEFSCTCVVRLNM